MHILVTHLKLANHLFEGFKNYKNKYDNVDESLTKITEENINNKSLDLIDTGKIFKVQLATSSVKIPILPENFNGLKDVEVYISGKFYKYTYGRCIDMETAKTMLAKAKATGYPSAFITAFENGNKINVNAALVKLNNKPNEN